MTSVLESDVDNYKKQRSTAITLDDIPVELLFYIFKKLDIKSLRCCFSVNRKWKEIAMSICELRDLWQELAEDGIVNHGVTHHLKSTLGWRDLYFNSLLWNNLQSASIDKVHEMDKINIKNLHVYRDKLIVISPNIVEYYDIETFESIRSIPVAFCEDLQESDDMLLLVTESNKVIVFAKFDKNESIDVTKYLNPLSMHGHDNMHNFGQSWHWRIVGNHGYVIDSRSVLWKCNVQDETLSVTSLARFYGDLLFRSSGSIFSILRSIHVIKEDVYISVRCDLLLFVSKKGKMFEKVNINQVPTIFTKGANLNTHRPYRKGTDKFYAFIKVPFAVGCYGGVVAPRNMLHFFYHDPEMTCGLQHGDVVFRGFEDGRVEITLLKDDSKLEFNVEDLDEGVVEDAAVLGLEVCELKNMHKLFIVTRTKLYTLLMTYPESVYD